MHYGGGEMGGMRYGGGEMGGMRYGGGYGGMSSFGRTPSFSSPGTFNRAGGEFRGYNPYAGGASSGAVVSQEPTAAGPSRAIAPARTRPIGGTIDYGAAGRAGVGPAGGVAGAGSPA